MNLLEYQGKQLFARYGITLPHSQLLTPRTKRIKLRRPLVLKSQVPVGNRAAQGGIQIITKARQLPPTLRRLWRTPIDNQYPSSILAEEKISAVAERYVSVSYDTASRGPVLSIAARGGTGIDRATTIPISLGLGLPAFAIREALLAARLNPRSAVANTISSLWQLFTQEKALLAEINPLFEQVNGQVVAGDAKVILDDHVVQPEVRPYVSLGGDIAVLASGGGASMLNLDALLQAGGRPANYVEYSGNPRSAVVAALTRKVLKQPGLKGCWVVGGTANFTDIYETLRGFVHGLNHSKPRPRYPIVIRRDGPRRAEAFAMLGHVAAQKGYDFHLFGPEVSMAESARRMVRLAYHR